ncbi:MAG TPA: redox-sensing transcriptional repressor Rex, partial [Enterococcus sp.]|nr:redox-sensing transcriptional repressor Rex [Enterococcus sp.]
APSDVLIQNVDLTNELQTLIYFLHSGSEGETIAE